MSDARPTLLIISFSEIVNDARVRKQVDLFAERYRVTTCGFGGQVREGVEHVQLEAPLSGVFPYVDAVLMRLRAYGAAHRLHPRTRAARRALRGRHFDAVLANDTDTLGVALRLVDPDCVHVDLHEYFPGLHDEMPDWVRLRKPYQSWLLRNLAASAGSATTVSDAIADRYTAEFGFPCGVVRNAAPYAELPPSEVSLPIRLVHSGVGHPDRRIEVMMEAVARSAADITLDLYLTGAGSPYVEGLEQLAGRLGDRVTVHAPVPYAELVRTLNGFDIGMFVLPPTNTNYELALPNKFFDFVQARLGILIGPTPGMEQLVREHALGAVSEGFDVDSAVPMLDALTPETTMRWKRHSDLVARELSAEQQQRVWEEAIAARSAAAR